MARRAPSVRCFLLGVGVELAQVPARWISSSALLVGVLLAASARAEATGTVEYTAAPGCPPADVFVQQVAARTPVFRERAADHAIRVELVSEPGGVLGRASLVLAGHAAERELRAARCEEVVEALALVVAILIDPNADTRPIAVTTAPPEETPPEPATPAPPAVVREPVPVREPRPVRKPPEPAPAAPARSGRAYRFVAGAHAASVGAVAPELTLGPRVFAGVDLRAGAPWPSSLRLSGARLFSRTLREGEGSATLVLDAGRVDACFLRLREGRLALEPCAGIDLGAVRVDGEHPLGGSDHTLLWAAAGGLVRSTVTVLDWLVGEAEIGLDVPLVQYRYSFRGQEPLFQSGRAGLHLGLGLGVLFP